MGWMQNLCQTYDNMLGSDAFTDGDHPLVAAGFIEKKAAIHVTLTAAGGFAHAARFEKGAETQVIPSSPEAEVRVGSVSIPEGAVYYGEMRRRVKVPLTPELRAEVRSAIREMHGLVERGHTPRVSPKKACGSCSLKDICRPDLMKAASAAEYVAEVLAEETL